MHSYTPPANPALPYPTQHHSHAPRVPAPRTHSALHAWPPPSNISRFRDPKEPIAPAPRPGPIQTAQHMHSECQHRATSLCRTLRDCVLTPLRRIRNLGPRKFMEVEIDSVKTVPAEHGQMSRLPRASWVAPHHLLRISHGIHRCGRWVGLFPPGNSPSSGICDAGCPSWGSHQGRINGVPWPPETHGCGADWGEIAPKISSMGARGDRRRYCTRSARRGGPRERRIPTCGGKWATGP